MITFQILFTVNQEMYSDSVSFLCVDCVTWVKVNNPHPALIWFSLNLGIGHPKHSKNSVKCLIIKFSIWPQLSTHFQVYFILLNTCLMETFDFPTKIWPCALSSYCTTITWRLLFCSDLGIFFISLLCWVSYSGSQFFYVGLFSCFGRNHPHTASYKKVQATQMFYTLKV